MVASQLGFGAATFSESSKKIHLERTNAYLGTDYAQYSRKGQTKEDIESMISIGMAGELAIASHLGIVDEWIQLRLRAEEASRKKHTRSYNNDFGAGASDMPGYSIEVRSIQRMHPYPSRRCNPRTKMNVWVGVEFGRDVFDLKSASIFGWNFTKSLEIYEDPRFGPVTKSSMRPWTELRTAVQLVRT